MGETPLLEEATGFALLKALSASASMEGDWAVRVEPKVLIVSELRTSPSVILFLREELSWGGSGWGNPKGFRLKSGEGVSSRPAGSRELDLKVSVGVVLVGSSKEGRRLLSSLGELEVRRIGCGRLGASVGYSV